ncbi:gata zinc finger domain-containing protein 10-related [Anaeramoeba flamelloides]|uniref:Gata zinc finger domain-containing protein 10-related n=1 Tax=Anaeramoeba flamelloides TaxID=1746091 RepID=A0AAV8A7T5_9EUKA|nr:gata zinc finger domain-containing protein 10-related [Anaeramoeba flamelloides]
MDFSFEYDPQFNCIFEDLERAFTNSNVNQNPNSQAFQTGLPNCAYEKVTTDSSNLDQESISTHGAYGYSMNGSSPDYDFLANFDGNMFIDDDFNNSGCLSNEDKTLFEINPILNYEQNQDQLIENSHENRTPNESIINTKQPNDLLSLLEQNETNPINDENPFQGGENPNTYNLNNGALLLNRNNLQGNSNSSHALTNHQGHNKKKNRTYKKKTTSKMNDKIKNDNANNVTDSSAQENNNNSYSAINDEIINVNKNKKPNPRKRRLGNEKQSQNQSLESNPYIVESGKEVFKLLTGQLWVITGGASQKILSPFTKELAKRIGNIFNANKCEIENFQSQLKYLLSNSRRTLTEFILEILIGILSLHYSSETSPEITIKFRKILREIMKINNKNKNQNRNKNRNTNRNKNGDMNKKKNRKKSNATTDNLNFDQFNYEEESNEQETNLIKIRLEHIYHEIFTQNILMYWFDKRFVDRLYPFFPIKQQKMFFKQHLFFLGKSKFILSCLLLAKDLMKPHGIVEQYHKLLNLKYNGNPLNLYCNNRGKKLRLVKSMMTKYSLNNGNYWSVISKDCISRINFTTENICQCTPFKQIFENNKLVQLSKRNHLNHPHKKRTLASKDNKVKVKINVNWLTKTGIF